MHITCLTKRWQHHTASGGYDRVAREVRADVVQRTEIAGFLHQTARFLWRRLTDSGKYLLDYRYEDWLAEWALLAKARIRRPDVVHVLYGDEQLNVLLRKRALLPCPLIATFHLPTSRVKERFERFHKRFLGGIDAAVVVSTCQLHDYRRWLGEERVVYVPHGVDTERFSPGTREPGSGVLRIITVGDHMRDWETLHLVIDQCNARRLPVQFDVVVREQYWPFFTGCGNTRLHTGLAEQDLVRMYQDADFMLLPLIDATACNAVLESLACGTPVVTNLVGGIAHYVNDECAWLFRCREVIGIVDLISSMCVDRQIACCRREAARRKALEFDWSRVAAHLGKVYDAVGNGRAPAAPLPVWDEDLLPVRTTVHA